jgi:glycosyltransferase involved in cell wall biosynthesis
MPPTISVLLPAYNAQKYIGEAIQSILDQSFKDFEFIIVDDGSTDRTWSLVQEYAHDARIKASQNARNLGLPATRNRLVALAQAEYIAWQDADDVSMPDRLERQLEFMREHPEVGICGGALQFFSARGAESVRKYASDDSTLRRSIFRHSPVAHAAALIRRECFEVTGLFPETSPAAEDLAMSFQIGTKYKFGNVPDVVLKYRMNELGLTYSRLRTIELYTLFLRERYSHDPAYSMSWSDRAYNVIQHYLVYLMPTKLKIALFNLLRNSRLYA